MSDEELVARFIAERGVTRCPAAYGVESTAEISVEDRAAHAARVDQFTVSWAGKNTGRGVALGGIVAHWRNKRLAELQRAKEAAPRGGRGRLIVFTPAMDETLRRLLADGRPVQGYIDKAMGLSNQPIIRRMRELGLPPGKKGGNRNVASAGDR